MRRSEEAVVSRPVSGILSLDLQSKGWPSIYAAYLGTSSGQPVPCLALLQVGFTEPTELPRSLVGAYRTVSPLPVPLPAIGGLFSVALSFGSPRLAVSQHLALWSPDFPQPSPTCTLRGATTRPHSLSHGTASIVAWA